MFLVGKGIPEHITSLPRTVLNTPFGQMLKPQLDSAMREITQASVPLAAMPQPQANFAAAANGTHNTPRPVTPHPAGMQNGAPLGVVRNVTRVQELDALLAEASKTCAVIFFTSATCPPCKIAYPVYDELAAEAGSKATLIKVDISAAYEIGARYQVRATPTFVTFLHGEKENQWSGADGGKLRGNVRMLIQMAHPPHPHTNLRLPTLQRAHHKPVTYMKMPPLDKLIARMGEEGNDESITELKNFIETREISGAREASLPSLPGVSHRLLASLKTPPPPTLFPMVDLLRLALVDPRISGYFAEEQDHVTTRKILSYVNKLGDDCPYNLRIVTLQMACNLFISPLFPSQLLSNSAMCDPLVHLVTASLLDTSHAPVRVAAASLAFNMAAFNHVQRLEAKADLLGESAQVELVASLLEAVGREEESKDGLRGLVLALGLLAYGAPVDGEVLDLCRAMDAKGVVAAKKGMSEEVKRLAGEVGQIVG